MTATSVPMERHLLLCSLAVLAFTVVPAWVPIPKYIHLVALCLGCIWIGSFRALSQEEAEAMSTEDAWKFPLVGSGVLVSLYIVVKMISKEYVTLLLSLYFSLLGTVAIGQVLEPLLLLLVPVGQRKAHVLDFKFSIPFWKREEGPFHVQLTAAQAVGHAIGLVCAVWYGLTRHWISNNIMGVAFSIEGIEFLALGSYKIGCILLSGLFFYDIFWVFGTDVMVTVAKNFDAPVKLLFPRDLTTDPPQFSLIGLGDIVIPGIFVAMLLRYDWERSGHKLRGFPTPYFLTTFFGGYTTGLLTTLVVMVVFESAQPALLYLVPGCIGASVVAAWQRGELGKLWAWEDSKLKEADEKRKAEEAKAEEEKAAKKEKAKRSKKD